MVEVQKLASVDLRARPSAQGFLRFLLCAKYVPAAPAVQSQLLSTKVVREARSRSSGCKVATFKYESSAENTFPQLRLQSCNF